MKQDRESVIIRTSLIGIVANVLLAAFKAAVGMLSHSIAVVMDAVNNLSDAMSSLITIVGTKLAQKEPDRKHPLGYGRIEYLSATVISVIVLYAGVTSLVESVKSILHPEKPDYAPVSLFIIAAAVAVKIALGTFVRRTGEKVNSDALVASGKDALFDSVISASTLAAAVIYLLSGVSLEAWLGAVISAVIVKSGVGMLRDTISEILGERVDAELARSVKKTVVSLPEVGGAYDLVIHNYGPEKLLGSVHIELPDTMTVEETDALERQITERVYAEHGVTMTGISVYAMNTKNDAAAAMRDEIRALLSQFPDVLQMHGFYVNEADKTAQMDVVISFDAKDRHALCGEIAEAIRQRYPEYSFRITPDSDISD